MGVLSFFDDAVTKSNVTGMTRMSIFSNVASLPQEQSIDIQCE